MEENLKIEDEIPKLSLVVSAFHVLIFLICGLGILKAVDPSSFLNNYERLILILAFGAVGGTTNASRHVVRAVRYSNYRRNRFLWQVLTPLHGAILASVGYVVLQGGIVTLTTGVHNASTYRYFIMGFSFFCGFSSELFIKKLIKAAESLFGESDDFEKKTPQ